MTQHPTKPLAVHTWDWKDAPDFEAINKVVNDFLARFGNGISLLEVSTGSDEYAVVIGDKDLTQEQANDAYANEEDIANGVDASGFDWEAAEKHLNTIRGHYASIGIPGVMGLTLILNPLLTRYSKGERSAPLYEAMLAAE
ncbi:hypothetical protein MUN82_08865 [Hymenobacter aerilatus]|uniref:Uncharacterized protein n=1 Tax=Hymenobacter aerilatus TaxID=2932251 RepID=A0A8T9T1Z0_9BACT|nr:hypothetical protein [Hymenobacter aerilatus]UOR07194.1 hypothetical protein MUN82_08865 [Hymenobacter aerilatus]